MKSKLCPRDERHYRYEAGAKFSQQKHPTLLSLSGVFSSQVIIWRGDITRSPLSQHTPTRGGNPARVTKYLLKRSYNGQSKAQNKKLYLSLSTCPHTTNHYATLPNFSELINEY